MTKERVEELIKNYLAKSSQMMTFEESQAVVEMIYDIWKSLDMIHDIWEHVQRR